MMLWVRMPALSSFGLHLQSMVATWGPFESFVGMICMFIVVLLVSGWLSGRVEPDDVSDFFLGPHFVVTISMAFKSRVKSGRSGCSAL